MVTIFAFNTGKAVMEDATIKVAINDLSDIGPKKAILLGKALIIDLLQHLKVILNTLIMNPIYPRVSAVTKPLLLCVSAFS